MAAQDQRSLGIGGAPGSKTRPAGVAEHRFDIVEDTDGQDIGAGPHAPEHGADRRLRALEVDPGFRFAFPPVGEGGQSILERLVQEDGSMAFMEGRQEMAHRRFLAFVRTPPPILSRMFHRTEEASSFHKAAVCGTILLGRDVAVCPSLL